MRQNLAMVPSDPTPGPGGERDVFGSLPNTRPQRRSAKRDRPGGKAKAAAAAKTAAPPARTAAAKPSPAASTAARPKAKPTPRTTGTTASKIPPAGYATPRPEDDGVPRGADLVTTAVQAAGELAHMGLSAGGRALKSALGRLPRP